MTSSSTFLLNWFETILFIKNKKKRKNSVKLFHNVKKHFCCISVLQFKVIQTVASPLRLELFHDVQEIIVDLRLVAKLQLDLVQIGQSIFHLEVNQTESQ